MVVSLMRMMFVCRGDPSGVSMVGQCQTKTSKDGVQACLWSPVTESSHKVVF